MMGKLRASFSLFGRKSLIRCLSLTLVFISSLHQTLSQETPPTDTGCATGYNSFELITGNVYSASSDTISTIPETLQLTDCLQECQNTQSCQSINFETGLCVLFNSSATEKSGHLKPSQFPVFTIYAQKVCFSETIKGKCDRAWAFERVIGYSLRKWSKRKLRASSKMDCLEKCLTEADFDCRSVNYDYGSKECSLSEMDRHTIAGSRFRDRYFLPSVNGSSDYFESNCVAEPDKLCDFKPLKGKVLKTVDSVYQDIQSIEGCREKCLQSPYRCFSFDLGEANKVCRTSHLDSSSLTHISEAYFESPDAVTHELVSCYNVTIFCGSREMRAKIKTNRIFNGKVYDKMKPNSCVNDISNSLDFEISMAYNDLACDVKQTDGGKFSNTIVLQHHDLIVTNKDLGLSIQCLYDLSNRTVANTVYFEADGEIIGSISDETFIHSATVEAPNVTIIITDGAGEEVQTAKVGEALTLRFKITDDDSPYALFVRELVAVDGTDSGEIVLIDGKGCPTDSVIMGPILKNKQDEKLLETNFDAFKFPTSEVVQFKAIVSPCVASCDPTKCPNGGLSKEVNSYGRRKRSERSRVDTDNGERLVVVKSLTIEDTFEFKDKDRNKNKRILVADKDSAKVKAAKDANGTGVCLNLNGIMIVFCTFCLVQIMIILLWVYLKYLRSSDEKSIRQQLVYGYPFVIPSTSQSSDTLCSAFNNKHQ